MLLAIYQNGGLKLSVSIIFIQTLNGSKVQICKFAYPACLYDSIPHKCFYTNHGVSEKNVKDRPSVELVGNEDKKKVCVIDEIIIPNLTACKYNT